MVHYYAKHFYAPVLISPALRPDFTVDVYLVNDSLPVFGVDQSNLLPGFIDDQSELLPGFNVQSESGLDKQKNDNSLRFHPKIKASTKGINERNDWDKSNEMPNLEVTVFQWSSLKPMKTWSIPFKRTVNMVYCFNIFFLNFMFSSSDKHICFAINKNQYMTHIILTNNIIIYL